jgi:hypothetical protein
VLLPDSAVLKEIWYCVGFSLFFFSPFVRRERAVWFFVVFTPQKVQLPPFLRLSRFHPFITCVRYICIPALGYSCSHFPLFHPFTKIPASSCVHNDVRPSFTPPTEPSRSCLQGPLSGGPFHPFYYLQHFGLHFHRVPSFSSIKTKLFGFIFWWLSFVLCRHFHSPFHSGLCPLHFTFTSLPRACCSFLFLGALLASFTPLLKSSTFNVLIWL